MPARDGRKDHMMIDEDLDTELSWADLRGDASPRRELVPGMMLDGALLARYEEVQGRINARAAQRGGEASAAAVAEASAAAAEFAARVESGDDRLSTRAPGLPAPDATPDGDGAEAPEPEAEPERDPEQDLADELRAEIRRKTFTAIIMAIPRPAYNALTLEHPPRKLDSGLPDMRDFQNGVNVDTFYVPLVRACLARPTLANDQEWDEFYAALNDVQFDKLANAAARVNRRDNDVPK